MLENYYAGQGADDPVAIDLPRGKYIPTFARRTPPAAWPRAFAILGRPLFTIHWQPNGLELAGVIATVIVLCGVLLKVAGSSCGAWFN